MAEIRYGFGVSPGGVHHQDQVSPVSESRNADSRANTNTNTNTNAVMSVVSARVVRVSPFGTGRCASGAARP
ncbi:hypothetical protein [Streptomyces lydicamycinicus]|uniref:hypothetical protein n=1 Tax=Streptomyces lydicamycinicus TaxID=1546107 RepID=UPI003C30E06E